MTFNAAKLAVLSPSLWKEINAWVPLKGKRLVATRALPLHLQESLAEALPLLAKMVEPGSVEENEAMNKAILDDATRRQAEEAQHQAVIDGGNAQLAAYQKVGLADTERNAKIIQDAIARRDKGVFCSVSVRNAVEAERSNLEWVKVAATPAATPVPPAPVDLLPNGEPVISAGRRRIPDAKGIHGTTPRPLAPSRGGSRAATVGAAHDFSIRPTSTLPTSLRVKSGVNGCGNDAARTGVG